MSCGIKLDYDQLVYSRNHKINVVLMLAWRSEMGSREWLSFTSKKGLKASTSTYFHVRKVDWVYFKAFP